MLLPSLQWSEACLEPTPLEISKALLLGGFRESNPGPLAPEASIMPLYQIPALDIVGGSHGQFVLGQFGHFLFLLLRAAGASSLPLATHDAATLDIPITPNTCCAGRVCFRLVTHAAHPLPPALHAVERTRPASTLYLWMPP